MADDHGNEKKLDTVRLQTMSRAFMGSATLFAAIELKLFTAVSEGDNTVQRFAKKATISVTNADRLMTMCAASGLLVWRDDHYINAPDVQRFLVEGEARYAAPWLLFTRSGWNRWGDLAKQLHNEQEPQVMAASKTMSVEYAQRYHKATASVGFGSGRRFSKQVDLSQRRKIMDLGGGSGAYSIVAVQNYPQLSAVVFDLPPVVEVTREFIRQHDVEDRVTTMAGNFTEDELPEGCDVAIMASNLPMYSRQIIQEVIRKSFTALLPGGEMHLVGEMLDDDRTGPADAAIWGLAEVMSNSTGITHTRADCVESFQHAGFDDIRVADFLPDILVRACGRKPT
jgi:cyclopropane fatty-acyl-phospholipid synthase-like methyltransferase